MGTEQDQQGSGLIPEHTPNAANLVAATELAIKAHEEKNTGPYESACVVLALELGAMRRSLAQSVAVIAFVPPSEETSTSANEQALRN